MQWRQNGALHPAIHRQDSMMVSNRLSNCSGHRPAFAALAFLARPALVLAGAGARDYGVNQRLHHAC